MQNKEGFERLEELIAERRMFNTSNDIFEAEMSDYAMWLYERLDRNDEKEKEQ